VEALTLSMHVLNVESTRAARIAGWPLIDGLWSLLAFKALPAAKTGSMWSLLALPDARGWHMGGSLLARRHDSFLSVGKKPRRR
jgi:hypothetical protein